MHMVIYTTYIFARFWMKLNERDWSRSRIPIFGHFKFDVWKIILKISCYSPFDNSIFLLLKCLKSLYGRTCKNEGFFPFCFSRRDVGGSNAGPCFSGREARDDARARHRSAPLPQVRQNLSVRAHPAHPHGGQAHHLPGLPVRALRHGGQVTQLAPLPHVAPAPRHIHQGEHVKPITMSHPNFHGSLA